MKVGYDGFCERCEPLAVKTPASKKPHYLNKSLDDLRRGNEPPIGVSFILPAGEPRIAVTHEDYVEFLRRMQTHPMTEGEVANLVIRRFDGVAAGTVLPDEAVYEVKKLRELSEAWISEEQEFRIRTLVNQYASRWKLKATAETIRDAS